MYVSFLPESSSLSSSTIKPSFLLYFSIRFLPLGRTDPGLTFRDLNGKSSNDISTKENCQIDTATSARFLFYLRTFSLLEMSRHGVSNWRGSRSCHHYHNLVRWVNLPRPSSL